MKKILALMGFMVAVPLMGQSFYVCGDGNVETWPSVEFSDNGRTLNGNRTTSSVDSITTHVPDLWYAGGDVSMLTKYEEKGAQYLDTEGNKIDNVLGWLKAQGWNAMRVRLFVDPSHDADRAVCQDLSYVKELGRRIKAAGLLLTLDFHYSDTWADPGKQWTPQDWQSLSEEALKGRIYDYTKEVLEAMNAAGASPDFIQTGNEISYGMLWGPEGTTKNRCYASSNDNWDRFTALLKEAGRACREVTPRAKIILHTERVAQPSVLTNFYQKMEAAQVDYDVIGLSYYPYFHGTLNVLDQALTQVEKAIGKEIQVVETGYPSKWEVPGTTFNYSGTYAYSPEGQRKYTEDLVATLKSHAKVKGVFWWWPEANEHGIDWQNAVTEKWYNAGLWDNETGKALPAVITLGKRE